MRLFFKIIFLGWWLNIRLAQDVLLPALENKTSTFRHSELWLDNEEGNLPKRQDLTAPSISVRPTWLVALRGNVSIYCKTSSHPQSDFYMWKKGMRSWRAKAAVLDEVEYPIVNVTQSQAGLYYCAYCSGTKHGRKCSAFSEDANITVIDTSLPKPFIKVIPQAELLSGLNATIACKGPMKGLNITLYKSRNQTELQTTNPNSDTALFPFFLITTEDEGNYTCRYQVRGNVFLWSALSDPAQLIVIEIPKLSLKPELTPSLLLLALFLLWLVFLLYTKRRRGATLNEGNQPVDITNAHTLSDNPDPSTAKTTAADQCDDQRQHRVHFV